MYLVQEYYKIGDIVKRKDGRFVMADTSLDCAKECIIIGFPTCEEFIINQCPSACGHCLGLMSVDKKFQTKECAFTQGHPDLIDHLVQPIFERVRNSATLLSEILGPCNLSGLPTPSTAPFDCPLRI